MGAKLAVGAGGLGILARGAGGAPRAVPCNPKLPDSVRLPAIFCNYNYSSLDVPVWCLRTEHMCVCMDGRLTPTRTPAIVESDLEIEVQSMQGVSTE